MFYNQKADPARMIVFYNAFRSVIAYDTTSVELVTEDHALKVGFLAATKVDALFVVTVQRRKTEFDAYEFEPEPSRMMRDLYEFYLAASIYRCLLENAASEQVIT